MSAFAARAGEEAARVLRVAVLLLLAVTPAAVSGEARADGSAAPSATPGQAGVRWFKGTLAEALARAKAEKKIVLLDAWAHWCGPCHLMDRETWSRDDLARALAREAVPVKVEIDRYTGAGAEIGDRYGIQALPHILFLDPETGEAVLRMEGAQEYTEVLKQLDLARAKVASAAQVLEAGNDSAALVRLAARLVRAEKFGEARAAADKAFAIDADCSRDDADEAALILADLDRAEGRDRESAVRLAAAARRCELAGSARELWNRALDLAAKAGTPADELSLLRDRAARYTAEPAPQREYARALLRAPADIAAAEGAAAKAVALDAEDPLSLAVMAEVRLAQKRLDEARTLVEKAIRIDPHDTDLRELRLRISRAAQ